MRLVVDLRDSPDLSVQNTKARKWSAVKTRDQAINQLTEREIVGWLQSGRTSFGWGTASNVWSKASRKGRRKDLGITIVTKMEQECYKIRAVINHQQGSWTTQESVTNMIITCMDVWRIPQARLCFFTQASYSTLPSP